MEISITPILLFLALPLFSIIILYRTIVHNNDPFFNLKYKYISINKKFKFNNYINTVNKKPYDFQKSLFKEGSVLIAVFFILYLVGTNGIFFSAVLSNSMDPTFKKDDLVLMQNIVKKYEVGDIIMFKAPDTAKPVSHRIASITEDGNIRTAGDAVGQMDWWEIENKDIMGKAVTINGKPQVIEDYGKFFVIDKERKDLGPFNKDLQQYALFFQIVKIYGYVIAAASIFLYIFLTLRSKPWLEN